ncbi:MAG: hypothetical protein AAB019_05360 [Planctomycetota bacterium]
MTESYDRPHEMSAVNAITPAFNQMIKVLFRPFNFVRWLKFGLVSFIVALGSGEILNINLPFGRDQAYDSGKTSYQIENIYNWVSAKGLISSFSEQENLVLVIILGIIILLVITTIWTILVYLGSRFSFVFLAGIIKNDLQIKMSYQENRSSGWSYFLWRVVFMPTVLLIILLLTGVPLLFLIKSAINNGFSAGVIIGLIISSLFLVILMIILTVVSVFTNDFVLPIMYLFKLKILNAWRIFLTLLKNNKIEFFIYLLLKIGLGFAAAIIFIIPCCLLGCLMIPLAGLLAGLGFLALQKPLLWIIIIPVGLFLWIISNYLRQVLILPTKIFFRSYSLVFLERFGQEFISIKR